MEVVDEVVDAATAGELEAAEAAAADLTNRRR